MYSISSNRRKTFGIWFLLLLQCITKIINQKIFLYIFTGPDRLFIIQKPKATNVYETSNAYVNSDNVIKFEDVEIGMHVS